MRSPCQNTQSSAMPIQFKANGPLQPPPIDAKVGTLGPLPFAHYPMHIIPWNQPDVPLTGKNETDADLLVLVFVAGSNKQVASGVITNGTWTASVTGLADGTYRFYAREYRGKTPGPASNYLDVVVRTHGPKVETVIPPNFGTAPGVSQLTVKFDPEDPVAKAGASAAGNYTLRGSRNSGVFDRGSETIFHPGGGADATPKPMGGDNQATGSIGVTFDEARNIAVLTFPSLPADLYRLEINGQAIVDIFGNPLEQEVGTPGSDYTLVLSKPQTPGGEQLSDLPSVSRGISGTPAPFVPYMEFTEPRKVPDGFNPSDKVDTRVVRLYYYRDAHRVAQIVNRDARSFNRVAVEQRRRDADQARARAGVLTDERRALERAAVEAARRSREAEHQLQDAQQQLAQATNANQQALGAAPQPADAQAAQKAVDQAQAARKAVDQAQAQVTDLQQKVQALRGAEVEANEKAAQSAAAEERARESQFRMEVAAAHEDPDTYAPGKPDSDDPVQQVSVSVIGDAMIQLRGPMKGVNIIRRMINQMDQPAGQVRVAIHTVQINGEHGDRMEKVAARIQDYIDHSRFLTQQSSLMLRKAVVLVASRRAEQAALECPGANQQARDEKYLYAFFGKDFTDELRAMDSEFLRSGNKLLALHSMDTTSLAAALFVLALAKNTTRTEILQEFQRMLHEQLPDAEQSYFEAGGERKGDKCEKFVLLAENARFQSFLGFFDSDVEGDDTLTPMQREFLRLAQIFKSELVTELEFNQRVMERALIEQRQGDYYTLLKEQKAKEDIANKHLADAQAALADARAKLVPAFSSVTAEIAGVTEEGVDLSALERQFQESVNRQAQARNDAVASNREDKEQQKLIRQMVSRLIKIRQFLSQFVIRDFVQQYETANDDLTTLLKGPISGTGKLKEVSENYKPVLEHVITVARKVGTAADRLYDELGKPNLDVQGAYREWLLLKESIESQIRGKDLLDKAHKALPPADEAFRNLVAADLSYRQAQEDAAESQRPLDQRKLLDMLIDEVEDKYIDLLEGTRAHTANIDDYIKRVATALDDDFNTQFYYPTFREVREASRYWDVEFGDIETTSVLTNNRMFAKVEPQATLEFDLPHRDILITEAMKDAKGMIDQYGALAQDPTFLALAKLRSGQPTSSLPQGASDGVGTERNVLPGLPRLGDEKMITQQGSEPRQLASPLEALIPDPAVYKFETGTGYEISPVIQPDGQSVVFHFNYMYTTNIREPVRADEKHLGRVNRHFIDTEVQLGDYELREISRFQVALKASRTSRGVHGLSDIPGIGILFRPLPSAESALQENIVLGQSTIYPTLFDLMGLRWAPAVADLEPLALENADFIVRNRRRDLMNRVFDFSSSKVDEFLRIPPDERRTDLYRTQETIPAVHPNGYQGPGLNLRDSHLQEGYDPRSAYPPSQYVPRTNPDGAIGVMRTPGGVPPYVPGTVLPYMPEPAVVPPSPPPSIQPAAPSMLPPPYPPEHDPAPAPGAPQVSFPLAPTPVDPIGPHSAPDLPPYVPRK